jgi:hypothetical protein
MASSSASGNFADDTDRFLGHTPTLPSSIDNQPDAASFIIFNRVFHFPDHLWPGEVVPVF